MNREERDNAHFKEAKEFLKDAINCDDVFSQLAQILPLVDIFIRRHNATDERRLVLERALAAAFMASRNINDQYGIKINFEECDKTLNGNPTKKDLAWIIARGSSELSGRAFEIFQIDASDDDWEYLRILKGSYK